MDIVSNFSDHYLKPCKAYGAVDRADFVPEGEAQCFKVQKGQVLLFQGGSLGQGLRVWGLEAQDL